MGQIFMSSAVTGKRAYRCMDEDEKNKTEQQ